MQLIILAAGQGIRLKEHGEGRPKSLVPIQGDRPYLSYEIEGMKPFDFSKKTIIGGYAFEVLEDFLQTAHDGEFELIHNPDYKRGNLYTLLRAKDAIQDDFILFNADHYYSPETYAKIFAVTSDQVTIFCDQDRNLTDDDMKVRVADGAFQEMSKTLSEFSWGYVGITMIPKGLQAAYWQACQQVEANLGDKANVESVVNQMAANGHSVNIVDISGSWWTEIDNPEDLERARETIQKNL